MAQIEIYTTPFCGYCRMAKRLFDQKGIGYAETDILTDPSQRAVMMQRANGHRSVPQIFIGGAHVGGCDDLYALERAGRLDSMLSV